MHLHLRDRQQPLGAVAPACGIRLDQFHGDAMIVLGVDEVLKPVRPVEVDFILLERHPCLFDPPDRLADIGGLDTGVFQPFAVPVHELSRKYTA